MNILGSTIKNIRKSRKMTQKQLSELTGFKQNTISNHENGNRSLNENDIAVYSKAFGISPQDLFNNYKVNDEIPIISELKDNYINKTIQSIIDTSTHLHNYTKTDNKMC